jgi:hypothetical protein
VTSASPLPFSLSNEPFESGIVPAFGSSRAATIHWDLSFFTTLKRSDGKVSGNKTGAAFNQKQSAQPEQVTGKSAW